MAGPLVYFYCRNEEGNLQEDIIALAEGFQELGITYYANCNYWKPSLDIDDYLFKHDPSVRPEDCDIVVVSYTWPLWVEMGSFAVSEQPLPKGLFRRNRKYVTVFMDNFDGYRTVSWEDEFRKFDFILRSKFNSRAWHPKNVRPWAYGLVRRITDATLHSPKFEDRSNSILFNFGASHHFKHTARQLAKKRFQRVIANYLSVETTMDNLQLPPENPFDRLMWKQTGGRFCRKYYERLKTSKAAACFCGDIIPAVPYKGAETYLGGGNKARIKRGIYSILGKTLGAKERSVGNDSFRFWETLAAGTAAINVELDEYGVTLPVQPISGQHYVGVNLRKPERSIEPIFEEPERLASIAREGKAWAENHYSPVAAARRFLAMVGTIR